MNRELIVRWRVPELRQPRDRQSHCTVPSGQAIDSTSPWAQVVSKVQTKLVVKTRRQKGT